jgi:hypothetical protein
MKFLLFYETIIGWKTKIRSFKGKQETSGKKWWIRVNYW